jgi:excisionase family DNA binding protein
MVDLVITRTWYTVGDVAEMLGFGLSKTKMLIITGELRPVKIGGQAGCCQSGGRVRGSGR